ncbi:Uncharacterised protein [Vibrio cholerae]|nr:Uncharacterised protein [Vibrio cholerae]
MLLESTFSCPMLIPFAVARAFTMWIVPLPFERS